MISGIPTYLRYFLLYLPFLLIFYTYKLCHPLLILILMVLLILILNLLTAHIEAGWFWI